jgi:CubicO group peptidase (beta-lactamase class C family)
MTKPVTAVAALVLVEECRVRLDDPVDDVLPELADRRVLARPDGPLDDTVPAARPITLRDLLTFRLGLGADFAATYPQPSMTRAAELGLGAGPPQPALLPEPDEFMRRLGTLPLEYQPGERWLYHVGSQLLGVLVARASGRSFPDFLAERVFGPLGMVDTGFAVPADDLGRFGPCYWSDPDSGDRVVYDPADGQWSAPPAFPDGGAGLVSTVDDMAAFGAMLRGGGTYRGARVLSRASVAAMTANRLTAEQIAASGPHPSGALGWGFGVGVQLVQTGPGRSVGGYGWEGGLGSSWANDPAEDLTALLLTNQAFTSPSGPAVVHDFWTLPYTALS